MIPNEAISMRALGEMALRNFPEFAAVDGNHSPALSERDWVIGDPPDRNAEAIAKTSVNVILSVFNSPVSRAVNSPIVATR